MKPPLQIGITGGIGSGKSLVCKIFRLLGISVYDAGSHAKALMTTDGILVSQIQKEFGDLSYHKDGSLNREWLASQMYIQIIAATQEWANANKEATAQHHEGTVRIVSE